MRGRGNFILFFVVLWCRVSGKVCMPEPGLVLRFTAAAFKKTKKLPRLGNETTECFRTELQNRADR